MEKQLLTSVIEKYYLGGIHEKVKWTIKDKKITILFTSATKDLAGSIEADGFDLDNHKELFKLCAEMKAKNVKKINPRVKMYLICFFIVFKIG